MGRTMSDLLESCRKRALTSRVDAERAVETAIVWAGLVDQLGRVESERQGPEAFLIVPLGQSEGDGFTERLDHTLRTPLEQIIAKVDTMVERNREANLRGGAAVPRDHERSLIGTTSEGLAKFGPVNLVEASSEAVSLVASSGAVKGVAVDLMALSQIVARGDRPNVIQIIVCILTNAVRFSPRGVQVVISIIEESGRACLTVADGGPGISSNDHRRIFEPRGLLGKASSQIGLGRALDLARWMGGDILLDSAPGKGARFTLELPLA